MTTTSPAPARRDWTTVGERFEREQIEQAIAALTWLEPPPEELPMIPALAIKAAITEFGIPKVSALATDGAFEVAGEEETAYFGLYGIEGNYANARVRVHVVDTGGELVPVAMDVWPAETTEGS